MRRVYGGAVDDRRGGGRLGAADVYLRPARVGPHRRGSVTAIAAFGARDRRKGRRTSILLPGPESPSSDADFSLKDALSAPVHRWTADEKPWKEDADRPEEAWPAEHVAPHRTPRVDGHAVREATWETRHG